jgi:hypothetical protein
MLRFIRQNSGHSTKREPAKRPGGQSRPKRESLQSETAPEKPAGHDKPIESVMVAASPRWLTNGTAQF